VATLMELAIQAGHSPVDAPGRGASIGGSLTQQQHEHQQHEHKAGQHEQLDEHELSMSMRPGEITSTSNVSHDEQADERDRQANEQERRSPDARERLVSEP
jgi:hypothetical protein